MKLLANNKKAYHEYTMEKEFEAGIVLIGPEVKSIKAGRVNIKESYISIMNSEVFILGMHVAPYEQANMYNVDPYRKRKLLLHRREIELLYKEVTQQTKTIVPLKVYVDERSKVKLRIALAKGKKIYDKRDAQREKDANRRIDQALKHY